MRPREQVLEVLARYCLALDDRRLDGLRDKLRRQGQRWMLERRIIRPAPR
jgi:hypothetical protein